MRNQVTDMREKNPFDGIMFIENIRQFIEFFLSLIEKIENGN